MMYFIVREIYGDGVFKATAESKTKLKKRLPRFCPIRGYCSLYKAESVSFEKYRKHRHLPDAPWAD